jgi:hypothetical protein
VAGKGVRGETGKVAPRAIFRHQKEAAGSPPLSDGSFASGYFVHAAISPSSWLITSSASIGGSNAARMTLAVCWMISKLSTNSEALPW